MGFISIGIPGRKEALLFVNKKQQKNFDFFYVTRTVPNGPEGEQKFFGSFFQKRTAFRPVTRW
jgi:hypothetical protein